MSKAHPPPVPPANRSPKGGSAKPNPKGDTADQVGPENEQPPQRRQGRQGNIRQNTTNQGYQQDR